MLMRKARLFSEGRNLALVFVLIIIPIVWRVIVTELQVRLRA